ncbi:MAG TPA: hypothetical protein VJ951_09835 [Bacteroidales bacterium]|nr:hypothetical protein [Bacteroidales bacterium]
MLKPLLLICGFILCFSCNKNIDVLARNGQLIARENCHECHSPQVGLSDIPMVTMAERFDRKSLFKAYLKKEFLLKENPHDEHDKILLSIEEIKEIRVYIKVLSGKGAKY